MRFKVVNPKKSAPSLTKEALTAVGQVPSFTIPVLHPYLVFHISYVTIKKGFSARRK
jgi:hypothetical protein